MSVSKGGQFKTRGNVITFAQDITNLCTTLLRLPEQLDILVIRKAAQAQRTGSVHLQRLSRSKTQSACPPSLP
jgi:hypothetical protein